MRIAESSQLVGSPRLCDLLLYVADCALRDSPGEVTEYQIGTQVFGRPKDFNSSEDSIVRTQARLLRIKLAAYFSGEGASEPITVEIPKGHYLPIFQEAATDPPVVADLPEAPPAVEAEVKAVEPAMLTVPVVPAAAPLSRRRASAGWLVAGLLGLVILVLGGFWIWGRLVLASAPTTTLWSPFFSSDPPLVIYSNALFLGDSKTGMHYAPSTTPRGEPMAEHLVDHYTGVGEVKSVYILTRLFDAQHREFTPKRSLLVTWDEAKDRNLIFVGAAAENSSIRVLPASPDFSMMSGEGFAGVVNNHPRRGEPTLLTRPEYPLTRDYAILSLSPGLEPGRFTFLLSGLTTLGTEAAVEFACDNDDVAQLLKATGYRSGKVRPFEAVLEVTVGGGVPLQSRLLLVHVH